MRLLFLSNYYPPFTRGGYEQWCAEVATGLSQRGHELCAITSQVPQQRQTVPSNGLCVQRVLHLEVEGGVLQTGMRLLRDRSRREAENLNQVSRIIDEFEPDVALIWSMWNVPRTVPALVEALLPERVAYYLCDYWPTLPSAYVQQWLAPADRHLSAWPKHLIGKAFLARLQRETAPTLKLQHPICVSVAVHERLFNGAIGMQHARVIYGGTELSNDVRLQREHSEQKFKLIYAGRLARDKGVHTAIEAMRLLGDDGRTSVTLDIIGRGDAAYERWLMALVRKYHLESSVRFRASVTHDQMAALLSQYDALVFPSEWPEPFARIVLEAMAVGVVVIGTRTVGTGEALHDDETGLTFAAGDAQALCLQIRRGQADPALRRRLAEEARTLVAKQFTLARMVDEIESELEMIAAGAR